MHAKHADTQPRTRYTSSRCCRTGQHLQLQVLKDRRVVSKVSSLVYNRQRTRGDKRLFAKDPDRSRYHLHASLKLFGRGSWIHGHQPQHTSVLPLSLWIHALRWRKLHQEYGSDISPCPGFYPTAACPEFHIGCRLGREIFALPVCCPRCPLKSWLRPKKLYHTRSVTVTPARIRVPIQRPLVRVSSRVGRKLNRPPTHTRTTQLHEMLISTQ